MRITSYQYDGSPIWAEISSNGWCNNHEPNGNIVYGINLSVSTGAPFNTAENLLVAIGSYVIRAGTEYVMLGGRLPRYFKHIDEFPNPELYMRAQNSHGRYGDPEVEFCSRIAGLEIVKLLPDYFDDPDSLNYGVLLRWKNPFHKFPVRIVWAKEFKILYKLEKRIANSKRTKVDQ